MDRQNQVIADWITKFQKLLDLAQESGNYTARLGATMLLRIDYRFGCDLELIVDLKRKTYKIEGLLHVKNITEKVKGEFSEDFPWELEGSLDEMKATPPEFQEFMEGMAGQITSRIRWKLEKKGKH